MSLPKVAVVILNWNGVNYLETFLPSVMATTYANAEIVVADNGSTDESVTFVQQHYPSIRVIALKQNLGFTSGYNAALKQVEADYYVLLNSDVEVQPGWIEPMVQLCTRDTRIAACQPKLLAYADKSMFEYAGAAGGWLDKYGYPFAKGRIFDICEEDNGQYNDESPIFWACGAALFIRASVFHEAGGFDPYFFAHQEEIDLCWRVQLLGHLIYSCPGSVVYHVGGGTLPRGNSKKTYLNFRNNRIMMSKNLPLSTKLWIMPLRNLLDVASAFKGLLAGDGGYFVAIVRAHLGFAKWWLFHRSKSVFPANRNAAVHGSFNGNMIWEHFVKGKKRFNEIVKKDL